MDAPLVPKKLKISTDPEASALIDKMLEQGMSAPDISEKLKELIGRSYSPHSISIHKNKKGIIVKLKKDKKEDAVPTGENPKDSQYLNLSAPPPGLEDAQKSEWYRDAFKKTHLYKALLSQLTIQEIDVYMQEYGAICCQFQDLVASEFFQIDDFLKHRVLISRQLNQMKCLKDEIDTFSQWLKDHPITAETLQELKEERMAVSKMLDIKQNTFMRASERYDSLCTERDKIHKALAATRRDRLEELKESTASFFDLVYQMQSSERARNHHGKYAELTKIAAEESIDQFRKKTTFPDGSKDSIILDSETAASNEDE